MASIDLRPLDRYLDSGQAPDDSMGLSDLDGFLTGIIAGPELILPSEWLPVIWGNGEPKFRSAKQAKTIIGLIMGRYNEIAEVFVSDSREFEPIFLRWPTGEVVVSDWACGFLDAVKMRRAAWEPLFSHPRGKVLLEPLLAHGEDGEHGVERDAGAKWKEFVMSKPEVIQACVIAIHDFWKDQLNRRSPRPRRDKNP